MPTPLENLNPLTVADALRIMADKAATLIEALDQSVEEMKGAASGVLPDGTPVEDMLAELKEEKKQNAQLRDLLRAIKYTVSFSKASESWGKIKNVRELINQNKII